MGILASKQNKILVQGITGREASMASKHMIEYGTKILAGVSPNRGGTIIHGVPVYNTVREAVEYHQTDVTIVYVPPRAAMDASFEAMDAGIKLLVIITERIPLADTAKVISYARRKGARIVGPNVTGVITPRDKVKLGAIGGANPSRTFVDGRVGVMSRSGGMAAETAWVLKRSGFGVSTAVSVGGDQLVGTAFGDYLQLYEKDEQTQAVVMFCEPGGAMEDRVAELVAGGVISKSVVAFVAGRFTETLPTGVKFGHAGAIIERGMGAPSMKIDMLRRAGVLVAERHSDIPILLKRSLRS